MLNSFKQLWTGNLLGNAKICLPEALNSFCSYPQNFETNRIGSFIISSYSWVTFIVPRARFLKCFISLSCLQSAPTQSGYSQHHYIALGISCFPLLLHASHSIDPQKFRSQMKVSETITLINGAVHFRWEAGWCWGWGDRGGVGVSWGFREVNCCKHLKNPLIWAHSVFGNRHSNISAFCYEEAWGIIAKFKLILAR